MGLAMSGATPSDSGLASGLVNTSAQVGGAIGLAVLATFASQRTDALRAEGTGALEALNGGYHLAYLVGAGLVAIGLVVALTMLEAAPASAGHESQAVEEHDGRPVLEPM